MNAPILPPVTRPTLLTVKLPAVAAVCSFFNSCQHATVLGYSLISLFFSVIFGLFLALGAVFPKNSQASPASAAFDLQGHRGARGLAPENTLAAFSKALATGVSTLELDIGVTADGVVVISHDPYLNPAITRNAAGQWLPGNGPLIRSLGLAQLQVYDVGRINPQSPYAAQLGTQQPQDGQRVPTLTSLFELVKARSAEGMQFNIETKLNPQQPDDTVPPEAMVQALLEVVNKAGMAQRVTVQSFDWRSLQAVQRLAPGVKTACLSSQSLTGNTVDSGAWTAGLKLADHGSVAAMAKAAGCNVWSPNSSSLTQASVKQAQALGLKVLPWTVNSASEMGRLLDWGVDGIITDYPDRLRALMMERKLPLPPAY